MTEAQFDFIIFFIGALFGFVAAVKIAYKRKEKIQIADLVAYLRDLVKHDANTLRRVVDTAIHYDHDACVKVLKEGIEQLSYVVAKQRIFTFEGVVVTFEPRDFQGFDEVRVNKGLQTILTTYPEADLTKHEKALGIRIIDVQGQKRYSPPPPSSPGAFI